MKYIVPLYCTANSFVGLNSDKIGSIIVEEQEDKLVEAFFQEEIFVYIKADQEKLESSVFPQPKNYTKIKDNIEKYGYSLYVKEENLNEAYTVTKKDLKYYQDNPNSYVYNKKRQEMKAIDFNQEKIDEVKENLQKSI